MTVVPLFHLACLLSYYLQFYHATGKPILLVHSKNVLLCKGGTFLKYRFLRFILSLIKKYSGVLVPLFYYSRTI